MKMNHLLNDNRPAILQIAAKHGTINVRIFGTEAGFQVYPPVVYREPRWGELHSDAVEIKQVEAGITPRRHFVDCVRDPEKEMIASGQECLTVMAVLDAVQRSAASGREVEVNL